MVSTETGRIHWATGNGVDAGTTTTVAKSIVGGMNDVQGRPILGLPLIGEPVPYQAERAEGQVGFVWANYWIGSTNPSWSPQALAYIASYPDGNSGWNAPTATTLVGGFFQTTKDPPNNRLVVVGELDLPVLQTYSSAAPLSLLGAGGGRFGDPALPRLLWAEVYATTTHAYARVRIKTLSAGFTEYLTSSWISFAIKEGEPMLVAVECLLEGVAGHLSIGLNDGVNSGGWG